MTDMPRGVGRPPFDPGRKRCDKVTALFTHDERLRVEEAARNENLPLSVFVHRAVLARLAS